jgi:excisionase family DNA binding protein
MVEDMTSKLMSIEECADYLGVHRETLLRWRKLGGGPPYLTVGPYERIRYRLSEVDSWIARENTGAR